MNKTELNAIINRMREARVAMLDVDSYLYPDTVAELDKDQVEQIMREFANLRHLTENTRTRVQGRQQELTSFTAEQRKLAILYSRARVR